MTDDDTPNGGKRKNPEGADFDARLRAARQQRGMDKPVAAKPGSGPASFSALGIGMRVGVELVSALVVAVAIGWGLDRWLHTSPAFLVVFVLLGGAAGVANVWRLMGPGRMPGGK
jgi:ATP synthase protein I